jgi:hypothetical protein
MRFGWPCRDSPSSSLRLKADCHDRRREARWGAGLAADLTKVAETSVMKDLLGRSAKAIGDYLGEHVEDFFNRLREQRRKNLHDHERKVAEVTGKHVDIFNQTEAGGAIEEWLAVAIDVPLEDTERAAVYQAVLAEILASNRRSDFQDVVDQLSGSGMRTLLNAPSERKILPDGDDRESFEKLRKLGLARKFDLSRFLFLFVAWCIGTGIGLYVLTRVAPSFLPTAMSIGFIVDGSVTSGIMFAAAMVFLYTNYILTEFGKSLQRSALRFYSTKSRIRECRLASLVPSSFPAWTALSFLLACGMPLLLSRYLPGSEIIRTIVLSPPPQVPPATPRAVPPQTGPQSPQAAQPLTTEDIATLMDVWRSVSEQMNSTIESANKVGAILSDWPKRVTENKAELLIQIGALRDAIDQRRVSVLTLANFYERYPNVRDALKEPDSQEIFGRLYRALDTLVREISLLPSKPPDNFEGTLRPYAAEVKLAATALADWAGSRRAYANTQNNELNSPR